MRPSQTGFFVGIDPGVNGGLACLTAKDVWAVYAMPDTDAEILAILGGWASEARDFNLPISAALEGVSASPQMGVVSAFTFGKGYGGLSMALTAAGIPFQVIYPIRWQNVMGCRSGGDKNVTKAKAQFLFPGIRVTHAIADALLLAECGRIVRGLKRKAG